MPKKIKRVYCAGLLTPRGVWDPNPAIDYLMNARNMIRDGVELLLAGFIPYVPALDFEIFLLLRGNERIDEKTIKEYSLSWLEVSDAVLLVKNWFGSLGVGKEMDLAKERNIPIFVCIEDIIKYNQKVQDEG